MAKEYMKATDYKIQTIENQLFKTNRQEIDKNRILEILETYQGFKEVLDSCLKDSLATI